MFHRSNIYLQSPNHSEITLSYNGWIRNAERQQPLPLISQSIITHFCFLKIKSMISLRLHSCIFADLLLCNVSQQWIQTEIQIHSKILQSLGKNLIFNMLELHHLNLFIL